MVARGLLLSPRYCLLICRGRSTKEEAGQVSESVVEHGGISSRGCNKLVSCCSCDKQSSQHVSAKREAFLCALGTKRAQSRERGMQ